MRQTNHAFCLYVLSLFFFCPQVESLSVSFDCVNCIDSLVFLYFVPLSFCLVPLHAENVRDACEHQLDQQHPGLVNNAVIIICLPII